MNMLTLFLYELQASEPTDLCVGSQARGLCKSSTWLLLTAELSLQALQVSEAEAVPLEDGFTFLMRTWQPKHTRSVLPQKRAGVTVEFLVMVIMAVFMFTNKMV